MRSTSLLIPRVWDEHVVAVSWEHFVQDLAQSPLDVRNVILESWLRCRSSAVDPSCHSAPTVANGDQFVNLRNRSRDLSDAARPVLTMLREVLSESGSLILLTDSTGTILDLNGESRTREAGEQINLAPGGCWNESLIGTNAIGTAIATQGPVQIYASEHYCVDVKAWTCAAAPILDPLTQSLLGVIDVSGTKDTFHGHSLGLVIAVAKQIESVLFGRVRELHERLLEHSLDTFARYGHDCVVLFDPHGRVVKNNGKLRLVQEQYGVTLPLEPGARIAVFDLTLPVDERRLQAPTWLRSEWIHPLCAGRSELGSMLVIPVSDRPASAPVMQDRSRPASSDAFADIVGSSPALEAAKTRARRLAPLDLPVMLLGETGVGKEVFARAIHKTGTKSDAPFVALNCGALTRELLASELFGYVDGAFTGARRGGAAGKFEQADGGTLFLDEIGEMPVEMQPHLLRVLQDGVVVRLGDSRERRVSVRIVAATNRDLMAEVRAGRFREDLYHRLCVTTLLLPPLRERQEDIDVIIEQMNMLLACKYGTSPKSLDPDTRLALRRYHWPGNIRELRNVFEALFALSEGTMIDPALLPAEIVKANVSCSDCIPTATTPSTARRLAEMEKLAIEAAVVDANGNLSLAARSLGISRSTLYVKLAMMRDHPQMTGHKH